MCYHIGYPERRRLVQIDVYVDINHYVDVNISSGRIVYYEKTYNGDGYIYTV